MKTKNTPALPSLIYDGDCGFCRVWIERWKQLTKGCVDYAPFQEAADRFPEIPREEFARSVQLITPQGEVFGGAEAVFRALAFVPGHGWALWTYQNLPGAAGLSERVYGLVARHRDFASRLTRILWGKRLEPPSHFLVRGVFLRFLGVIYLLAFLSLWRQLPGLVGSQGILPAAELLTSIRTQVGPERYWFFPTLAWLNAGDGFLQFLALGGAVGSLLAIAGVAPVPVLAVLWLFYLSLDTVCGVFLHFQWDALLLETGFLAILFAPGRLWPNLGREARPSWLVLWLLRLLLFRLVFGSGAVKLLSGDPTWRHLTALSFHYETQPLPTPLAWYANQLPLWFQKASAAAMFFTELVLPWLVFSPRRPRFFAALAIIFFQVLIALTGNYAFFNLLTVALCLLLLDDQALRFCLPRKLANKGQAAADARSESRARRWITTALAFPLVLAAMFQLLLMFSGGTRFGWARETLGWLQPLEVVNHYGLFAVMTTSRPEIVIEGSNDDSHWQAYEFKYKPGDLSRPPPWVAPHQPRLDWQLWFAALGNYQQNPWFVNFMARLLQGSPPVLALLEKNPFPGEPPRYLRASIYEYRFSDPATRRSQGAWWGRQSKGLYFPVVTLRR